MGGQACVYFGFGSYRMTEMYDQEKHRFYEIASRRFKAELKLYGATAAIHLENKNDEMFWGKVLHHVYPQGKFRFISSSRSHTGNITAGCTQCLQYLDFLDKKFWIAIDSDYRYLDEQPFMRWENYVLQTYTYSFENHFCFGPNLNLALQKAVYPQTIDFDFCKFLKEYSRIVYPLMVWQLYLADIDRQAFPQSVFHRMLSVNVPVQFWKNDGAVVLNILRDRANRFHNSLKRRYPDADYTWHEARCNELGVNRDNCYLYVRGHNLYDLVVYMGKLLVSHARSTMEKVESKKSFEYYVTSNVCFGEYAEILKLTDDVRKVLGIDI